MPDDTGGMTADERKRAVDWINEKWRGPKHCPICKNTNWALGEDVVAPIIRRGSRFGLHGPVYPQIMLICSICGLTYYFNAIKMGIVSAQGEESAESEEQEEEMENG